MSYDTAFDLTRDRNFAVLGSQLTASGSSATGTGITYTSIAGMILDPATNPVLRYEAASQQASVTLNNGVPQPYPQSQISLRDADRIVYTSPDGFLSIAQPGPSIGGYPSPLRYVVFVVQNSSVRNSVGFDIAERRFVGGSATNASDVPRTGAGTYRVLLTSYSQAQNETNSFVAQNADVTIDYVTGAVRGTIVAASTISGSTRSLTFSISGQLSGSSNRFTGSITNQNGAAGQISGELYGPSGTEFGFVFALGQGAEQIIGTVVGGRR